MWQQAKWLAVLAIFVTAPAAWGQSQAWRSKPEVAALTKRIDDHIAAAQKAAGVNPAPPAAHAAFFRRIHLDLAGMIPTLIDMSDYLANDDPDKLWEWSERFLEQKAYSRHFAAVWRSHILNAANQQATPFLPPFEQWLKDRLQNNQGYDRLVRDLLAPGAESNGAMMGFRPGGGAAPTSGNPAAFYLASEYKAESLAGAASRIFLGVKLECAQCHAHPFAKWTKDEFWQFAAFFVGTQPGFNRFQADGQAQPQVVASTVREITIPGTDKVVKAKFLTGEEPKWKANEPTRSVLADWITSPKNPYFAKATVDMVWQYFFGVSLLEPIMEPSDDSPITHPQLLNDMAQSLIDHEFDLKFLIRAILHTQAYQRSSDGEVGKDDYVLFVRMPVRGLSPEQLYDSVIEAAIGPKGHEELRYQPSFDFGPRQPAGGRAEFLSKFISQDRRHESQTSILQALFLMNGKFLSDKVRNNDNLDTLADAMSVYPNNQARIRVLFLMSLSREPRPDEYARLVAYLDSEPAQRRQRLGDILWALLNSAEFRLNH